MLNHPSSGGVVGVGVLGVSKTFFNFFCCFVQFSVFFADRNSVKGFRFL